MPLPLQFEIKRPGSGGDFDLLPDDVYQVEVSNIDLIENDPGFNGKPAEDKLNFEFTITESGKYQGRKLWKKVRIVMSAGFSKGQPSGLYKLFCAVNGINLSESEAQTVTAANINDLLHKQVRVTVKQKEGSDGKIYSNIVDFLPLKGLVTPLAPPMEETPVDDVNPDDIPF